MFHIRLYSSKPQELPSKNNTTNSTWTLPPCSSPVLIRTQIPNNE
jgi:hypothetical protein